METDRTVQCRIIYSFEVPLFKYFADGTGNKALWYYVNSVTEYVEKLDVVKTTSRVKHLTQIVPYQLSVICPETVEVSYCAGGIFEATAKAVKNKTSIMKHFRNALRKSTLPSNYYEFVEEK